MRIENNLKKVIKALSKGHTLIAGQTQYGKSTAAAYFFTQKIFPGSSIHIFMDTKHDDSLLEDGYLSRTIDEFRLNLIL